MKNRTLCWTVLLAVSLCLVFLGVRLPNLSKPHKPKPRPRAVIETSVKAGQPAGVKVHVDVATCQTATVLTIPTSFGSSFQQEIHRFNLIPIGHHTARAPPVISA